MSKGIQITDKTKCSGCTACANVCPTNAIIMKPDEEGFLYPHVRQELCLSCGICEKTCPICNPRKLLEKDVEGYIVRHRDPEILEKSTSGGAFTAFASKVIADGGVVYGAGYDENMRVICKKAKTVMELEEMRGSKFVQSELGTTFRQIAAELKQGITVLFTGAPCQVEGLLAYLKGKPENLICIDFVCRGVPSPKLWANYVQMMEHKYHSKMVGARFKHKTYGYHATTMKIDFENGKSYYGSGRVDPMMKAFVMELASRPSCGSCAFKTVNRSSDITMFDCYGFSKIMGISDDNKGYSSILVHSKKGSTLLEEISDYLELHNVDVNKLISTNGIMAVKNAKPNTKRDNLYKLIQEYSIDEAVNILSPITWLDYIIEFLKKLIYKVGLIQRAKEVKLKLFNE